jgi:hypothetical protein
MGPLVVVLVAACSVLALLVVLGGFALRRAGGESRARQAELAALREEVGALARRQAELEIASTPSPADYVITFDDRAVDGAVAEVPAQRVVSATLGEPLIKVAAFGHGVRRALGEEQRAHLRYQVRREYRRRRKASRARARRSR